MYIKIILNNVKKNLKDYSIYFLTLMMAVALFYAFNSLDSQEAFKTATSEAAGNMAKTLINVLSILSKFIAVSLAFLIIYANNYLLKRRKKELGIYMLLGMENRRISSIFVGETVLIGIISFIFGIGLGAILSQGISIIALKMFIIELSEYNFVFSTSSLINTLISFCIIFFIVALFNVSNVSRVKLIDLLNAGRKNENFNIKNKKLLISTFIFGIFILLATAFIIYNGNFSISTMGYSVILVVLGTLCITYSFFGVLLNLVQKNHKWYFKDINSFLIRQISSKIKTNYLTITIVCLLLSATICVVSVGMGIVLSLNDNAEEETPYDFLVIQELDDENLTKNETIQEYFSKNKLNLDEYLEEQFEIHVYEDKNFTYKDIINNTDKLWSVDKELSNESVRIISNSDYNKILKSQNKKSIELPENTYLLNCNYKGTKEHLESFIKKNIEINILGTKLKPAKKTLVENVLHLNLIGRNDPGSIIVPDNIIKNSNTEKMIILNGKCSNKNIEKFDNLLLDFMNPKSPYTVMTKTLIVTAYFGTTAITAFICCYIGIIFLIICVAILSLQQLTETFDNIYRYSILQKIGVEKRVCNHTIFKQIAIYFVTPVALASIYSAIVLPKIISKINDSLGLNIGANLKLTIILFLIIYGGYFLVTYFSCKNMITERVIMNNE